MKRLLSLVAIGIFLGSNLIAQNVPIRIDLKELTNVNYPGVVVPQVIVTAITDSIVIKDIVVNKGNCFMNSSRKASFPKKISYGEQAIGAYSGRCHVLHIEVKTNKGDWSVEY